jgi:methyltransferase (TIGR00027 family)
MDPVSRTARLTAAARARESRRPDRLFDDPLAEALAGPEGFALMERLETAARPPGASTSAQNPYIAIRTRYFDDFLTAAAAQLRQVVLVAAGLDTRAFRLAWPPQTSFYELDRPELLAAKQAVLDGARATARCTRVTVGVDLTAPWQDALLAAGFDRAAPSLWMVEGLLPYLDEPAGARVIATTAALAAPGSRLGADSVGRGFLESPHTRSYLQALERENAPWRFGTDEPEAFLAAAGWNASAVRPGDDGISFGRWPFPMFPRGTPGAPQTFLITATRA